MESFETIDVLECKSKKLGKKNIGKKIVRGDCMYFKRIFTPGLSHYAYMIGDGDEIAVIDPMRDIEVYIEEARKANKRIKHIFETHRNEDYISGSMELSEKTGADIYISKYEELGHVYGNKIGEEDEFRVGKLRISPIHTPGHTRGHLSYVLYIGETPYMVFVGDTLFWGDLGRTDFYGEDKLEEMTGHLYDSIFKKLFSLGDHVLMMPAHGAGSACGGEIENRDYSTIGYERKENPALQVASKEEFVEKHGYMRLKSPYFDKMETCNTKGAAYVWNEVLLNSLNYKDLEAGKHTVIDIRSRESYSGKHIPKSIFASVDRMSAYLGWIVDTETPIAFLTDGLKDEDVKTAYWTARRMGYDNIVGAYGADTINSLERRGVDLVSTGEIGAKEYLEIYRDALVLDIRRKEEVGDEYPFKERVNIPLQLLAERVHEIKTEKKVVTLCGSGERATVANSILERAGIKAKVVAGGVIGIASQLKNRN